MVKELAEIKTPRGDFQEGLARKVTIVLPKRYNTRRINGRI